MALTQAKRMMNNTSVVTHSHGTCAAHSNAHSTNAIKHHLKNNTMVKTTNNYRVAVFLLTILMFICAFAEMSAQAPTSVKVSNDGVIKLSPDNSIQESYTLDLSYLNFSNDDEMIAFLSDKSGQSYYLRSKGNKSEAIMIVRKTEFPNRTKQQWAEEIKRDSMLKPLKK